MKLNLGCGQNIIPGWENHDADVDLRKPLPWPDNAAEFILLEHVLEHFNCAVGYRLLEECYRVLQPGGILRVCVPDVLQIQRRQTPKYAAFVQSKGWGKPVEAICTQHGHEMLWNEYNLLPVLISIGFSIEAFCSPYECDGHAKVIGEAFNEIETLSVEASK